MKNWLKENWFRIVSPIVVIVLFTVLIGIFSGAETRFQCFGEMSDSNANVTQSTLYVKITENRRWWRDSDGYMNLEIPNTWSEYYPEIEKTSDGFIIYNTYPQKQFAGVFSKLSNALTIFTTFGDFKGSCKILD